MAQRDLHTLLTELHTQLRTADAVDPASHRLLQLIAADIRALTETGATAPNPSAYAELRDRLGEAVLAFEGSHPELTKTFENAIDTLSQHTL